MAKVKSYRTLNNRLLRRIGMKKSPKAQLKALDKVFEAYERKMEKNSSSFFNQKQFDNLKDVDFQEDEQLTGEEAFNKYTLNSIRNRIANHIKGGRFDELILRKQLANLVKNSREYQKQKVVVSKNIDLIESLPPEVKYNYIITNAEDHSKECERDLANQPTGGYSRTRAKNIMLRKPNHINCECKCVPISVPSKFLDQGRL